MNVVIDTRSSPGFSVYASPELVVSREVLGVGSSVGSNGNQGSAFLGFKLSAGLNRAEEWLVCTIYGSFEWLTVNGQWLFCHPLFYKQQRPLMGSGYELNTKGELEYTGKAHDDFRPMIINKKIISFESRRTSSTLRVGNVTIEIAEDPELRPRNGGDEKLKVFGPSDDVAHAWVLAKDGQPLI